MDGQRISGKRCDGFGASFSPDEAGNVLNVQVGFTIDLSRWILIIDTSVDERKYIKACRRDVELLLEELQVSIAGCFVEEVRKGNVGARLWIRCVVDIVQLL